MNVLSNMLEHALDILQGAMVALISQFGKKYNSHFGRKNISIVANDRTH